MSELAEDAGPAKCLSCFDDEIAQPRDILVHRVDSTLIHLPLGLIALDGSSGSSPLHRSDPSRDRLQ